MNNEHMGKPEKTAIVAILVNTTLTTVKFVLAFFTGSLALMAEAFHSLADIGSSSVVFLAIRSDRIGGENSKSFVRRIMGKNPQRRVATLIGVFLFIVSISIFREAFVAGKIVVNHPVPAALTMLLLSLMSFLLSRFESAVGDKTESTALIADGIHSKVDMLGSLLVSIALFGESLSLDIDRPAAMIIAAFILLQSVNVFAAVTRDYARNEKQGDYFFPQWLLAFHRESWPGIKKRIYIFLGKRFGISPDEHNFERRVSRLLNLLIMAILIVGYMLSGIFTVAVNERAVVERFGEPRGGGKVLGPGIHYRAPWPIDRVRKVDTQRVRRMVVGSEIMPDSKAALWTNLHYVREFNVLSGENIFLDVGVIIYYRVSDPYRYIYGIKNPDDVLSEIGYSVLLRTAANNSFFDMVTVNRDQTEKSLFNDIIAEVRDFDLGIKVLSVNLRDLHPPTDVALDFEEVVTATVDYETYINEAHGYANDLIPVSRGEAEVMQEKAQAKRSDMRKRSRGESEFFLKLLDEYRKAPQITRHRLFIETMEAVLAGREKFILPPESVDGAVELFMTDSSSTGSGAK